MKKRGISPIVASILLVVIVVVLAMIIFIWARYFISESLQKNNRPIEAVCGDVNIVASISGEDLIITNNGNVYVWDIRLKEISVGSSEISDLNTGGISPGASYTYTEGVTGEIIIIPKLLGENEEGYDRVYICDEEDGYTLNI